MVLKCVYFTSPGRALTEMDGESLAGTLESARDAELMEI